MSYECRKLLIWGAFGGRTPSGQRLWRYAFGGVLLRLNAFGASALILGQRLWRCDFGRMPLAVRLRRNGAHAARAPSAGQERTSEMTRRIDLCQRLWGSAFGERQTPSAVRLRRYMESKSETGQGRSSSPPRLRRCTGKAKSTDNGKIKFNFQAWEFAQRRSVKPSVRRRPLRLQAGARIKWVDPHSQVSNGEILIAEGRRLILAISISISLERRPRSRKLAERN